MRAAKQGLVVKLHYTHNLNPRVAVAAARHLGAPVRFVRANPRDPKHIHAFRALNPNALAPVLEDDDGSTLWETDAIVCRLSALVGSDFWRIGAEQPKMIQWISWATHHLNRAADPVYFYRVVWPTFSRDPIDQAEVDKGLRDFREHAAILDAALANSAWLVGDRPSYADFRAASALPFAEVAGLPLEAFPAIRRWHDRLLAFDAWRDPFAGL